MGFIATDLLDRLARRNGDPAGAREELVELLAILRQLQDEPGRRSSALDEVVKWLDRRLGP